MTQEERNAILERAQRFATQSPYADPDGASVHTKAVFVIEDLIKLLVDIEVESVGALLEAQDELEQCLQEKRGKYERL